VILAGGAGTRLWPLARARRPKQFLSVAGRGTLFQQACRRAEVVASRSRVLVVCGQGQLDWVRRQAPWIPARRIIAEGRARNTAASVALAAHWIRRQATDGIMVVIPSDHRIDPLTAFRHDVRIAARAAQHPGTLVILGVPATTADTGFGYIHPVRRLAPGELAPVRAFVEKPARARAARFLERGDALWNCGLFVWRASSILEALEKRVPALSRAVLRSVPARGARVWRIPGRLLSRIMALPVDKAVLEHARGTMVVRATFNWSDLGSFDALASILKRDIHGNRSRGRLIAIGARDCVNVNAEGITLLVGVRDLIVVRDEEAVMVCPKGWSQRVRDAGRRLVGSLSAHA
jgi:mannose-1-phosphate guanylyltransferase/mannose-6-phosphate isomerase